MSWQPSLSEKQNQLVAMCHRAPGQKKYILCSGPRYATKTIGCLAAIAQHAWNVNMASISCIAMTVTAADDMGFWTQLTQQVIPEWIAGNFGMRWVTEPRQKGTTKKMYFQVTNRHGTTSTVQLDSLEHEEEVEKKFKNKGYSMIYISELSNYKKRATFDILIESLRGQYYSDDDFLLLGDTNPAPEGQNSWIYQLWYDFRVADNLQETESDPEKAKSLLEFQSKLGLMEFSVSDNIFMSDARKREQFARYMHNPDLMARYHDGKWICASDSGIFIKYFKPEFHIIGGYETRTNKDPEILLPEEDCQELITGWDLGATNHAFVLHEKVIRIDPPDKDGNARTSSVFKALDELVWIGTDNSMVEFVDEVLGKLLWWQDVIGHPVRLRNWSDRSAFDRKEPIANIYHHQLVYNLSRGQVVLQCLDRTNGPVVQRVELTKKLLSEHRWVISRSKCPNLIESLQSLEPGKGTVAVNRFSRFKHAWDAGTYSLASECYDELLRPKREVRSGRSNGSVVTVNL